VAQADSRSAFNTNELFMALPFMMAANLRGVARTRLMTNCIGEAMPLR
jgi:hypothetical protein